MNELIRHKAVYRTALATPGLLKIMKLQNLSEGIFFLSTKITTKKFIENIKKKNIKNQVMLQKCQELEKIAKITTNHFFYS